MRDRARNNGALLSRSCEATVNSSHGISRPPIGTPLTRVLLVILVILVAVTAVAANTAIAVRSAHAETAHRAGVASTSFGIPAGAKFVATTGHDSNAGTQYAPFATVAHALAVVPPGGTIVLRAGVYREALGTINKRITIESFPGEQAWLSGSRLVTGFAFGYGGWSTSWHSSLCDTCYPAWAIDPAAPAAGLPEQVFVGPTALRQVVSRAALAPGTFYVDRANGRLWLGADPFGAPVDVTVFDHAVLFAAGAAGSIVRGIGFEHYGPHYTMDVPAMVIATAPSMSFVGDTFAWSATRGLSVIAPGATVTDDVFTHNGLNGFHADKADGLDFARNTIVTSNDEHFSTAPGPAASIAGAKITRSTGVSFAANDVEANDCNGIWFDISSYHVVMADNRVVGNAGHGVFYEISGASIIAGNVVARNGRDGIRLSGSTDVQVWNNTSVDNAGAQLSVYEDPRTNTNPAQIALGITWDTGHVTAYNNVLAATSLATQPTLTSMDTNQPKRTTSFAMLAGDDDNAWVRTAGAPVSELEWQLSPAALTRYASLATAQAALRRELHSFELAPASLNAVFADPAHADYGALAASPLMAAATPLPAAISAVLGAPAVVHFGALDARALAG
jgi:hypothetical protein